MKTQPGPPQLSANTEHAATYFAAARGFSEARSPGARGIHRLVVPCLEGLVRFVQPFLTDASSVQAALSALDEDCASRSLRPAQHRLLQQDNPYVSETNNLFTDIESLKRLNFHAAAILSSGWGASHDPDRFSDTQ